MIQELVIDTTVKSTDATTSNFTKRVTSKEIEELLYQPIPVLDHGFIRVVDYMGNDSSIVQAARVSYGRGTKLVNQDQGLIKYLMRNSHTTPFEMCEIKFHIKLPIFIARQWIRHRTGSFNEYSARYSILNKEFYVPDAENLATQSEINKQCRSKESLPKTVSDRVMDILKADAENCYEHYTEMMNIDANGNIIDENKIGIARELARMNLTLNYYTEWYWKVNLHNLFHFLKLRVDPHAQYEIRIYAEKILEIVKAWVPMAYTAFEEYKMQSASFSKSSIEVIKRIIKGEKITQEISGLSKSEWGELKNILLNDQVDYK